MRLDDSLIEAAKEKSRFPVWLVGELFQSLKSAGGEGGDRPALAERTRRLP